MYYKILTFHILASACSGRLATESDYHSCEYSTFPTSIVADQQVYTIIENDQQIAVAHKILQRHLYDFSASVDVFIGHGMKTAYC